MSCLTTARWVTRRKSNMRLSRRRHGDQCVITGEILTEVIFVSAATYATCLATRPRIACDSLIEARLVALVHGLWPRRPTGFTHLTGRLTGPGGRSRRPWRRIVPTRPELTNWSFDTRKRTDQEHQATLAK